MLEVKNIDVFYGKIQVLYNLNITIRRNKIVALLGSNGAGKTTLIKAITGLLTLEKGSISLEEQRIDHLSPWDITKKGLILVAEDRLLFPLMSVIENLELGAYNKRARKLKEDNLDMVFSLFPILKERCSQASGTLSGGEQQMLTIGRALMARPKLLILDEPSLGLAPKIQYALFDKIKEINEKGVTIFLAEQNASMALSISHQGYIIESGKLVLKGGSKTLRENKQVREAYLGI